ncbi:MAG: hypothetical protein E7K59_11190 [Clostridium perfringens]|nr:hypothetical protein [Clostridium perfringens]
MNEKIKNVLDSINFKNSYLERDSEDEECVVYNYFSNGIVFADNKERIREYTILLNVYSNKRIDFRNEITKWILQYSHKIQRIRINRKESDK